MKRKARICFSIFVLLLMVVLSSGLSFSRYTSTVCNTGDESTVITVNKYNLIAQWGTELQDLQHPGMNEQSYDFYLKNEFPDDSETVTEDLSYTITVDMDWNDSTPVLGLKVPLNMELYIVEMNEGEESLDLVSSPVPASMNVNRIITEGDIDGGESIHFRLKWNWGSTVSDRDYRFADKEIDVKIDVNAEQMIVTE